MLKKRISKSWKFTNLKTDKARLLYLMIYPHLDIEGRIEANPRIIKADAVPLLKYSLRKIEKYLEDMHRVGLIKLYTVNNEKFLEFTRFKDFQTLRADREAKSHFPKLHRDSVGTPPQVKLSKVKLITSEKELKVLNKKEEKLKKDVSIKKSITPTKQMFGVFQSIWLTKREKEYKFTGGKDGNTAQRLWRQCKKDSPKNPLEYFTERVRAIMEQHDIYSFGGVETFWNSTTAKKKSKSWID